METIKSQIIIIGSGIAGLYSAIKLAENNKQVLLITKGKLGESNSRYAQGGIVGVLPENTHDSIDLHVNDTVKAGAGLTDIEVARFISENSSEVIKDLVKYGVPFDREKDNSLALTLEAAHSVRRILHAGGDSTGKSIEVTLAKLAQNNSNIQIMEKTQIVELLTDSNDICCGIIAFDVETNNYKTVFSSTVIIASGGIGQVYSNTTNPKIATGDGIALAYRANAVIQDMEFVQFHPTALTIVENGTRFLISESVRGEGAKLRNIKGELFAHKYDERGDLAPRDIVTRSIFAEMKKTGSSYVFLDASLIDKDKLKLRFPTIFKACKDNGIDISKDNIPVSPAAHFSMGGVKTSTDGQTSIQGLFAVGEAGCTSLHGANRLASNSLLECLVVSKGLIDYLSDQSCEVIVKQDSKIGYLISQYNNIKLKPSRDISADIKFLKSIMWQNAGIVRNQENLIQALNIINRLRAEFNKEYLCNSLEEYEYRNLLTVAELIIKSAIARKESRGAHFREDYPVMDTKAYHSDMKKGGELIKDVILSKQSYSSKAY